MTHLTEGLAMPPTAMNEMESLSLKRAATGRRVLELGAEYGYSTVLMASVAVQVVSVDWHQGYTAARHHSGPQKTLYPYLDWIRGLDNVVPVVGRFEDVLSFIGDETFDLVFLDGNHDAESVRFCLEHAERVVRCDGVVATHDYGHPQCDERDVCDELGWVPRLPVIGTLALFDASGRKGIPTGKVPRVIGDSVTPQFLMEQSDPTRS